MTKLWYNNINVLLEKPHQFFPSNNLNDEEKINALARLAIYYSIIILITKRNTSYLTFSIVLLGTSFLLGRSEKFSNQKKKDKCYKPTESNPFMNFTLDDYYKDPNRPKNCDIDEVRDEMKEKFFKRIVPDPTDIWGQSTSDRNFYTTPSTRIVNDQTGFAKWCYGTMGECKTYGRGCLKNALSRTGTGMFGSPL
tara:strand:+ start:202 stop:786 length:585 start_codon:yes stop_codon:yes gene_type:complete